MFVVCFSFYASLVSTVPVSYSCQKLSATELQASRDACVATRDPVTTCEARQAGALKWFITRRYVGGKK